jgi:ElaB/YqjD/DUF883 family membrane-anchored ribosome-binding protein
MDTSRLSEATDVLTTNAKEVGESIATSGRNMWEWTAEQVRERPYHALGVAALMGLIGLTAWARRDSLRQRLR